MQLSRVQALQMTSFSGGGLHGGHTHASPFFPSTPSRAFQVGSKRQRTESLPSDSDETDEDDVNPYHMESERTDLSDSQSDTDAESEQNEPDKRCNPRPWQREVGHCLDLEESRVQLR